MGNSSFLAANRELEMDFGKSNFLETSGPGVLKVTEQNNKEATLQTKTFTHNRVVIYPCCEVQSSYTTTHAAQVVFPYETLIQFLQCINKDDNM